MTALRVFRNAVHLGYVDFRYQWGPVSWLVGYCVRIVSETTFYGLIGVLLGSAQRVEYLVVGNSVFIGCATTMLAAQAITWDRFDGTYPLLVVAPSSYVPAVVGRTAVWVLDGMATAVLALFVVSAIFGLRMDPLRGAVALPLIVLTCLSTFCLALFVGGMASLRPGLRNMISILVRMTILAICGVNVPVAFWPVPVQVLAGVLPVTHGVAAIRLLLAGAPAGQVMASAGLEAVVGAGWLAVAVLTFDRLTERGRASGSIEFV
ncbi:MAG TPA: ABC transporter permease [Candidatus Dormibacteraeota bacterium]|nr:ABC transporter permease [Candidatus Dormibacteraeota bacterium]